MFETLLDSETLATNIGIIFSLLLLEAVLSFDNAAILAAMVRRLPKKDRRKALFYGLVGAYVLRIGAILLAAWLINTPSLKVVGGAYLLWLFVKHFYLLVRHRASDHESLLAKSNIFYRMGIPMLAATVIQIELVDLAFAVDQVVVAVAFTDKIGLIITAALVGILFLRLAAAMLARVMDWLPLLEHMAYVAVGFVGMKLIFLHPRFDLHIPTPITLAVTLSLFGLPVLLKLAFDIPRSRPGAHAALEDELGGSEE